MSKIPTYKELEQRVNELEHDVVKLIVEKAYSGESTFISADEYDASVSTNGIGKKRWISSYVYPIIEKNSEVVNIVVVHEDVTKQINTEQSLKESEMRFREMAELLPGAIVEMNKELILTYVNQAGLNLFGYSEQDLKNGLILTYLIHPDDRERATQRIADHYAEKRVSPTEYRALKKDGTVVPVLYKALPVKQEGEITGFRASVTDISRLKQAEIDLRESEGKFRAIVENTKGIIFIIDKNRYFVLSEGSALAGLGLKPGQMVGMDAFEVYKETPELIKGIKKALQGETFHDPQLVVQGVRDQRYYDVFYTPRYIDGKIVGIVGEAIDITERTLAENMLRESEQQLNSLVQNVQAAVIVHDADTKIVVSNIMAQELLGLTEEQVLGKAVIDPYWKFLRQDQSILPYGEFPVNQVISSRQPLIDFIVAIQRPDKDELVWVLVNAVPVFKNKKEIYQIIITFTDITERKQAEEQIKSNLKEKETLLHEIHHRVKNNLTVIASLLKLQANSMEDERIKAALSDSQSRVQAMSDIHEILYTSENLSTLDMNSYLTKLTRDVIQNYTLGTKVNFKIEAELILVGSRQASPIGLIVNELITNSLKYAFPDTKEGEIKINLQKTADQIELTYMDNGIGIPENFDWYNTKSMGLNLVKILAENQLDGSIDMESNNGTKFTIKFNIDT